MITLEVVLNDPNTTCDELDKIVDELSKQTPIEIEKVYINSERGKLLTQGINLPTTPGVFMNGKLIAYGEITMDKLRTALNL